MSKVVDLVRFPYKIVIKEWLVMTSTIRTRLHNFPQLFVRNRLKPLLEVRDDINLWAWFLLFAPLSTAAFGTWQLQRKIWKENLLAEISSHVSATPIELPENLDDIHKLEYYPVHVSGHYLHDQEIYVGPRSFLKEKNADDSSIFSSSKKTGYWVITPFKLENKDKIILINRGWVPRNKKDPKTRSEGQVDGMVDVTGIVRLHENRPVFMPENTPGRNTWFYRDLEQMCKLTGASPIFLDATSISNVTNGPIGGQTRVNLRNEHLSYIIQGYSISAVTAYMWYKKFIKRKPL